MGTRGLKYSTFSMYNVLQSTFTIHTNSSPSNKTDKIHYYRSGRYRTPYTVLQNLEYIFDRIFPWLTKMVIVTVALIAVTIACDEWFNTLSSNIHINIIDTCIEYYPFVGSAGSDLPNTIPIHILHTYTLYVTYFIKRFSRPWATRRTAD